MAKILIFLFSSAIFSQNAYKGDSESKTFGLFQRTYFMDGTLAKNSTTNISAISSVACVESVNMRHICIR